jgi:hypothetical protein
MSLLHDFDDELAFDQSAELTNPLAAPLVAALRKVRTLHERLTWSAHVVKASVELLRERESELQSLRRRNLQLVDELREYRRTREIPREATAAA